MLIAVLYTIARRWKQPKCSSTEEWIKKMLCVYIYIHTHTYTVEYIYTYTYSGILICHKKNEIMPFVATWMDLDIIMLSEVSQTEKDKYHMISLMYGILREKKKRYKWTYLQNLNGITDVENKHDYQDIWRD